MSLYKPFNCECLSKDHTLNVYFDRESQMVEFNFGLIFSNSVVKKGFLQNMFWRLKYAFKILFSGFIKIEDTWLSAVDDNSEFKRFVEYYHYYFIKPNTTYGLSVYSCCDDNGCSETSIPEVNNGNVVEKKKVKSKKKSGNI